jgi:hypothetical protein
MKITTLSYVAGVLAASVLLASCGSSSQTASSFGARKYTEGYFVNTPSATPNVASNPTLISPKAQTVSKVAVTEKTQPAPVSVVANNAPENAVSVRATDKQVMPAPVSAKKNLSSLIAAAKTQAIAKTSSSSAAYIGSGKTDGIETTAQVTHSGGGDWSFKSHPVRWILIGLFIALVVVLFVLTGGQGISSREDD